MKTPLFGRHGFRAWALLAALALSSAACAKKEPSTPGNEPAPSGSGSGGESLPEPAADPGVPPTPPPAWDARTPVEIDASSERVIAILGTNDIHGSVEAAKGSDNRIAGGAAQLGGVVRAIRKGLANKYGADRAGTVLVDGGDQFQGTLISNYDEGQLTIAAMSAIGYDAVVPGNHDYDFGPIGWLDDRVVPGRTANDPRETFKRVIKQASFPFVSANTYENASLLNPDGTPVGAVEQKGCTPRSETALVDWSKAKRPDFLAPYVIKHVAGLRVAIIGVDHIETHLMTTVENVSDLCFRDEVDAYNDVRDELEGRADVFVMVIHNGAPRPGEIANAIASKGRNRLHAIVSGHTHRVESSFPSDVPVIQSGANGEAFGQIQLVWSDAMGGIDPSKTRVAAGVRLMTDGCSKVASEFCEVELNAEGKPFGVSYHGEAVAAAADVQAMIRKARATIEPLTSRKIMVAKEKLTRDRNTESPLANLLADAMRDAAGADIAFVNGSGIRTDLPAGDVNYELFFKMLPFNNRAVVIGPVPVKALLALLQRSAASCGKHGSIIPSGVRVKFEKNCEGPRAGQEDPDARLLRVELSDGRVILDVAQGIEPDAALTFTIATFDFLRDGGSGYAEFKGWPLIRDLGVFREITADRFAANPPAFDAKLDGRFQFSLRPVPTMSPVPERTPRR